MQSTKKSQRLYVLVPDDLNWANQAVQAGHGVGQFMIDHPLEWENGTLIFLEASRTKMDMILYKLQLYDHPHSTWKEPDIDNRLTAIATTVPVSPIRKLKKIMDDVAGSYSSSG